jgi:hypothetical protein
MRATAAYAAARTPRRLVVEGVLESVLKRSTVAIRRESVADGEAGAQVVVGEGVLEDPTRVEEVSAEIPPSPSHRFSVSRECNSKAARTAAKRSDGCRSTAAGRAREA